MGAVCGVGADGHTELHTGEKAVLVVVTPHFGEGSLLLLMLCCRWCSSEGPRCAWENSAVSVAECMDKWP